MNKIRNQGFSLIEVMISLVIVAVGLLALSKFHTELFQSTANAQSRTIALNIAEAKLEDLRYFSQISQPQDTNIPPNDIPWSSAADPMAYVYINDDAGGKIVSGTPTINGETFTGYSLTWDVTDLWHDFSSGTDLTVGTGVSDLKQINVTVTWDDEQGETQQVSLMQNISSTNPGGSYLLANATSGSPGPDVEHTLGALPDVVPLCVSGDCTQDGLLKETDNPEPEVSSNEDYAVVSFSEVTYVNGTNIVKKREDFQTVNCACTQAASTALANYPSHIELTVDVDGNDVITNVDGGTATKRVGTRINTGQSGQQSEWCDTCCRDHHDDINSGEFLYDPFRENNTTNYPVALNGDHSHFDIGGNVADSIGDDYIEACKMVRVDGLWRVAQDWRQETVKVMPASFLFSNLTDFQDYVGDVITEHAIAAVGNMSYPQNIGVSTAVLDNEPDDYVMSPSSSEQLVSRSIYIDYMPAALRAAIDVSAIDFEIIPFHDINTTKLSIWGSDDTNLATVTNENIEDNNTHSRGMTTALSTGTPDISSTMRHGNTGFTNSTPVYPEVAKATDTDDITLDISGGTPPTTIGVTGSITRTTATNLDYDQITITGGVGVTCSREADLAGPTFAYTCSFPASTLVSVTLSDYNVTSGAPGNRRNNTICSTETMVINGTQGSNSEETVLTLFEAASTTLNISIVEDSESCP